MYSKLDKGYIEETNSRYKEGLELQGRPDKRKERNKKNTSNERLNETTKREMKIHYLHQ